MKEWQRTIILVLLLGLAIGYLVWSHYTIETNFTIGL